MTEPAPEWDSRKEALHWFDHAAFIAQARVTRPAWYSVHAEDYVDVLCWSYQRCIDAEYTGPAEAPEEEDADADQTEQQTLIADGGRQTDDTSRRSIAREHLYGATVWAYGNGGASVQTWDHGQYFSKLGGDRGAE